MSGLFGAKKAASQASKAVSALQVQTSTSGIVLPLLYGANLLAGNLGWFGNWIATPHTDKTSQGGKGGGSQTSSTTTYTYTTGVIILLCEGQINGIGTIWNEQAQSTASSLGFTVFNGATPQSPWSWLSSYNAAQAVPYTGMAYVAASSLNLGSDTSLPNFNFEVLGPLAYNAGTINDALPSDIITDYLTNPNHGAGFGGYLGSTTNLRNYCLARGLFMSPIEDQQRTASSFMDDMASWCNFACVWSYNQLNLIPYGDVPISGTYGTYTPNMTPIYDLGADDFIYEEGSQSGVEIDWADIEDSYNSVSIEYNDRSQGYNTSVQNAKDQADIDARGPYPMSDVQVNGITTAAVALDVAQLMLQRSLYIRKTYTFKTNMRYMLLEPMDLVTLTDPNAGLSRELVRITQVSEQDDEITFTAEECPIGVASAPLYNHQTPNGYSQDYNVAPGSVSPPVIFNAPGALTQTGYETWIAVAGIGQWWGGCVVYVSEDNVTYQRVGIVNAPARYGALTAALPAGADPDTTNTAKVALLRGQLTSGTQADADNWRQLAFIGGANGGEFISFESATLTGTEAYTLSYLRRGGYGSTSQAHVAGDVFARIDDAIARLPYDSGKVGKTVYFKFVSFNTFGGGSESLASVTAYSHVLAASDVLASPLLYDQLAGQYATPASGSNFIPNPSFELNNINAPNGVTAVNQPVCDSWYIYGNNGQFMVLRDTSRTDVDSTDLTIQLAAPFSLPASGSINCRVVSSPIYVSSGQILSFGGDVLTDTSGGNGANVSWSTSIGMLFFNASGSVVAGGDIYAAQTATGNASTGVYQRIGQSQITVPAGSSYAVVYCYLGATNTSASAAVALNSWASRFDSLNGLFVTSAGQVNYTTGQSVDSLKPAQAGADVTATQTIVGIVNPQFELPNLQGWTCDNAPDAANWYAETGTNGPITGTQNYCVHHDSAYTSFLRNAYRCPVAPGQVIKGSLIVKGSGNPTGTAAVRLLWQDATGADITSTIGQELVGNGTQTLTVTGTAPANAAFCQINPGVGYATGNLGYYTFDNVQWNAQPSTLDEVPDGTIRFGSVYAPAVQSSIYTPGSNLIFNPCFQLGLNDWSVAGSGWTVGPSGGEPCAAFVVPSSATTALLTSTNIVVGAGVALSLSLEMWLNETLSGGDISADIQYYNSSGAGISGSARAMAVSATNGAFTRYILNNQVTPAGTAYCNVRLIVEGASGPTSPFSPAALFRRVKLEVGTTAGPFNDAATQHGNKLTQSGSGQQIGDQRNLKQRTVTNIPAKVPTTISYTATAGSPATATISVGAFTVLAGSVSTSYNASSVSVTGTNGAAVNYYLYMNDPNFTGGAQTLIATTNGNDVYAGDGYVYVGPVSVTYPTSGGGSGSGGGGGAGSCVCADMWLDAETTAGDALRGFLADCMDMPSSGLRKFRRRLQGMEMSMQPCVRLTTDGGAILECSSATPFDLPSGGMTYAPQMEGLQVVTDKGIETVASVIDIGEQLVCHQHYGGCSYAAGKDPAHRIYSHNVIAKP